MRFTFALEAQHLRAFDEMATRRLRARTKETRRLFPVIVIAWIPFGYAAGTYVSLYENNQSIRADLVLMLLSLCATAAILWLAKKYKTKLRTAVDRDNSPSPVQRSVLAEPERLEITCAGVRSCYEWSRFIELLEDEESLYLFLGSGEAVVIPKDAFPEPADLQQFQSWARSSNKLLQPTREDARA